MKAKAPTTLFDDDRPKPPRGTSVHFSSATDVWATPQSLFDELHEEFAFTLHVCARPENAKCDRYVTPETDGLTQAWTGVCWMNPPYGRTIGQWMRKAYESAQAGATVVALVPARTDTEWWHEWASKGEVRFIRGRLRFGAASTSAPFPSAIVIFRPPQTTGTRWQRAFFRREKPRSTSHE